MKVLNAAKAEINIRHTFSIKINNLIVCKNNRCTKIKNACVGKGFYNKLGADTICIAACKTNNRLFICNYSAQMFLVVIDAQVSKFLFACNTS